MQIVEINCKTILTRASGYLKPVCTHSLNPYTGCGFGRSSCGVGCYVRFNQWLTRGRMWGGFVDVKINAPEIYLKTVGAEKRWAEKRNQLFAIFLSSSTDPWQPIEKKYRVTRRLLEAIAANPPDSLILQTHSATICDDFSSIARLAEASDVRVQISIEGDRETLPGLPPPPCSLEDRLVALEKFSHAGISTVACLSPLYPLKAPEKFFARLAQTGVSAIVIDHFIEGDGTPDGSRTFKTPLPAAMEAIEPGSASLAYRDKIVDVARKYLPVGISQTGFAGNYAS